MGSTPVLTVRGHRADVRLNRPDVHNRIEAEDLDALDAIFAEIERDPDVRVAVLSSGGTTFSAGYHLGALGTAAASAESVPLRFERTANRLEALPIPTICALQGSVFGGSVDLALACDFRIGVDTLEIAIPAARLGIHFYRSGISRLVSRLGPAPAKRILLTADRIRASELLRIGYLDQVVNPDELESVVSQLAERIASLAPIPVRGMKQAVNSMARGGDDAASIEAAIARCLESEDHREGLRAWAERRSPRFSGC
jgi:enoyl-CoA hydratase/carnithine racemase